MTTEQLNVIITAQTDDFTEKLSAVNRALGETISLAERAAAAAARVVDPTDSGEAGYTSEGIFTTPAAVETEDGGFPSAPLGSARDAVRTASEAGTQSAIRDAGVAVIPDTGVTAIGAVSPVFATANAVRVDRDQTPFGVYLRESRAARDGDEATPIEIRTTVELDGDRIGEAVASYNGRRNRITDGFTE
ncbi:MAG: hypothetical protein NC084_13645 [Bacteroides sp.]|nr:hypothetical protein [Eubacterium sp.]MCM1419745.1 hypothetical protein [Roseburia sp.]MCM1463740.1 hypothetical protein [Bacteroides sp.]